MGKKVFIYKWDEYQTNTPFFDFKNFLFYSFINILKSLFLFKFVSLKVGYEKYQFFTESFLQANMDGLEKKGLNVGYDTIENKSKSGFLSSTQMRIRIIVYLSLFDCHESLQKLHKLLKLQDDLIHEGKFSAKGLQPQSNCLPLHIVSPS